MGDIVKKTSSLQKVETSLQIANRLLLEKRDDDWLIPFRDGNKWGYSNVKGEIVIPCTFDEAHRFSEGLAGVKISGSFGFVNTLGDLVIPAVYDKISDFHCGMSVVFKFKVDCVEMFFINKHNNIYNVYISSIKSSFYSSNKN